MTMWTLPGQFRYAAGTSGTVAIPRGAKLLQVHAHASAAATVSIFGGDSLPIPTTGWGWQIQHLGWVAGDPQHGSLDIVFTGTDAYFVEYVEGVT